MTYIQQKTTQITQILKKWNHLEEHNQQRQAVNFMIDLLPSASILSQMPQDGAEELKIQLTKFKENYQKLFGKDISQNGQFDLNVELREALKEIDKIDRYADLSLEEKQQKTQEFMATTSYQNLAKFREELDENTQYKYQLAHASVSYNYGEYFRYLEQHLPENQREEYHEIKSSFLQATDSENYFNNFVKLVKFLDLPQNFDKLKQRFNLDGLQEHTLINQNTGYIANLDPTSTLDFIEQQTLDNFFANVTEFKSIKEKNGEPKLSSSLEVVPSEITSSSGLSIGFELETDLTAQNGSRGEDIRQQSFTQFQRLARNLADNSSRINMRSKYGLSSEEIAPTPNLLLLHENSELVEIDSINPNISKITEFLKQKSSIFPKHKELFEQAENNLKLLTDEEIFIFDLFFINQEKSSQHRLSMDDIFDWRDNQEKRDDKFLKILEDIAYRGSFYHKTVDMIRATELAIGEFPVQESSERFSNALIYFRKIAEKHSLRAKDRGIQINIGQENIKLFSDGSNETFKLWTEADTADIGKLIQKSLTQLLKENPQFERKGLKIAREISDEGFISPPITIDRVKGFGKNHFKSQYTITFDPSKKSADIGYISAFPIHRENTGKSDPIRLAKIGSDSDLAVFEIRLIGNNPHWPYDDRFPRIVQNQAHDIVKKFTQILQREFIDERSSEFLPMSPAKSSQEISEVAISPQGKLVGLRFLEDKKKLDDEFSKPKKSIVKPKVKIIEKKYSPPQVL